MPKIYNKIINSPTPPKNTSDIWECNGKFYLYKGGGWEALKTDSEYYELPFDFCTLYLLQQGEADPIKINASEISKAIQDNKIIIMKYDSYCAGGYVLVSAYVDDLIYLSAIMENRLIYLEFGVDADIIGTENITYKVIGEGGSQSDWNAQEGKPGYIANKPFYTKGDIRQIDVDGEYEILVYGLNIGDKIDISWDLTYYDGEIVRGNTSFVIEEGVYHYSKDNFNIYISDYNGLHIQAYAFGGAESHYGKVTVVVNGEIKTLEEKYIPDTVLKTTPQRLTNTDKNQALANLGIDPIVWKYICNPCIAEVGNTVPSELITRDQDYVPVFNYKDKPSMYKVKYEGNIYNVTYVEYQTLEFIKDNTTLYMVTDGSTFTEISDMP